MTENEAINIICDKAETCEFYFAEHDHYPEWCEYEFLQALGMAIKALKEIQQCREAVEKQKPVKSEDYDENPRYFVCPSCGCTIMADEFSDHKYCLNCGQALLREENFGVIDNGNV